MQKSATEISMMMVMFRSDIGEVNDELITYTAGKEPSINGSRPQLNARTIAKLRRKNK